MKRAAAVAACLVVAASLVPAAASAGPRDKSGAETLCQAIPVTVDSKSIHVGGTTIQVAGKSKFQVCVTYDITVEVAPTVTFYKQCGELCFAVRLAKIEAYEDLRVELTFSDGGKQQSVPVDSDPLDVAKDSRRDLRQQPRGKRSGPVPIRDLEPIEPRGERAPQPDPPQLVAERRGLRPTYRRDQLRDLDE